MSLPMPLSITGTSGADPSAMFGGSSFGDGPVYNKPLIDFKDPVHVGVLAGAIVLFFVLKKKFK